MGADLLEWLRALAAIATAAAAIIAIKRYLGELKVNRRLIWQKTSVQQILQDGDVVSFLELKKSYRAMAASEMKARLDAKDITDEALRIILIDLCADNVVVQMGNDNYAPTTYLGQMQSMQATNSEMLTLQKIFFEAQLKFLANQDASIKEMLKHQQRVTDAVAPRNSSLSSSSLHEVR
ncbi:MAG: hypothetical protein ABJP44_07185 [Sulfitobacter sp.]|uniref:hypothetical protein n=1 Tax=Sulfitobacter sp. TaxID=1903071 RepID=UPI00329A05C8